MVGTKKPDGECGRGCGETGARTHRGQEAAGGLPAELDMQPPSDRQFLP